MPHNKQKDRQQPRKVYSAPRILCRERLESVAAVCAGRPGAPAKSNPFPPESCNAQVLRS